MEHDPELEGIQVSRAVTVTRHVLVVSTSSRLGLRVRRVGMEGPQSEGPDPAGRGHGSLRVSLTRRPLRLTRTRRVTVGLRVGGSKLQALASSIHPLVPERNYQCK